MDELSKSRLRDVSITETGDVVIGLTSGATATDVLIDKTDAVDALMTLLRELARASEKPGPAYRMMVSPTSLALEAVSLAQGGWVPALLLQLGEGAHLRVALRPEWLPPLSERLLAFADQHRRDHTQGPAH